MDFVAENLKMPEELRFPLPDRSVDILARKTVYISPNSGESFSSASNSTITFTLPNSSLLNLKDAYLVFTATATATTTPKLARLSSSAFSVVRARFSTGQIIEEISNYGYVCSAMNKFIPANYRDTIGKNLHNDTSPVASGRFLHHPCLGLFNSDMSFPAIVLPSVILEFTMNSSLQCTTAATTDGLYTITNCQLVCERLDVSASYQSDLLAHIESKGLTLEYPTFITQSFSIAATSTHQTFRLGVHRDLSDVYFFQILDSEAADKTVDIQQSFKLNTLYSYQYIINGIQESAPVTTGTSTNAVAYYNTLRSKGLVSAYYAGSSLDYTDAISQIFGYDFSASDLASDATISIDKNLILDLVFTTSAAATLFACFVKHSMIQLKQGSVVVNRSM